MTIGTSKKIGLLSFEGSGAKTVVNVLVSFAGGVASIMLIMVSDCDIVRRLESNLFNTK